MAKMGQTVADLSDTELQALAAKLIKQHPLPWVEGKGHETMCQIMDANGYNVCTVVNVFFLSTALTGHDVAGLFATLVNRFASQGTPEKI